MLDALHNHAGVPLAYQPVIEDGTYDEIKACVFRVCSMRICEVALEDMEEECRAHSITCVASQRKWHYAQERHCVTVAEMRFQANEASANLQDFFLYLAKKYEFVYNRICLSRPISRIHDGRGEHAFVRSTGVTELEVEILWPYWT